MFAGLIGIPYCLSASPVIATSYSMPNGSIGSGTVYLPCPGADCTTSGAALSGGTGKLTDGVISGLNWDQQPNGPSTFVGWNQVNPTITFFFSGLVFIDSVSLHVDDALNRGLVYLPSSVTIAGHFFSVPPDNINGAPRWLTFNNLGSAQAVLPSRWPAPTTGSCSTKCPSTRPPRLNRRHACWWPPGIRCAAAWRMHTGAP
jgi:hypothetical protein